MTDLFDWFNSVLEIKVYYIVISILTHVGLQTLVNHFHYMRADQDHTKQLTAVKYKLDRIEKQQNQ